MLVLAAAAPAAAAPPHVPGSLPPGFRFHYADGFHGWPVLPLHVQHAIRGGFLDPRGRAENGLAGYHFGIDISVDDAHPERGAPAGMSHRVYALEGGYAYFPPWMAVSACVDRRVEVGHFSYWHVSPTVHLWQRIRAGDPIGWTCRGNWHVHLSEWAGPRRARFWVNPLHAHGKIAPYADTRRPFVAAIRFFGPPTAPWRPRQDLAGADSARPLDRTRLFGPVEVRAWAADRQSFWGFLSKHPRWQTTQHPYRLAIEIRSEAGGRLVLRRSSFRSDQLPATPYLVHYAPGTIQSGALGVCMHGGRCGGVYWFRPLSRFRQELWNTRSVPNGGYEVTVHAWDLKGNEGSRTVDVTVANPKP